MIANPWAAFSGKKVLLLQGPVGPFFRRLSRLLCSAGAEIYKVNFNGGDCLFYPTGADWFLGSLDDWPRYFEKLIERLNIDIVLLFGDCRRLHRVARQIAHKRGVQVGAFEEGYVRPNFITFERFGVNGYSLLPRRPGFYAGLTAAHTPREREVGNTFWWAALWATLYYVASSLAYPVFHRYGHHRPLTLREAWPWIRGAWRKQRYRWSERRVLARLTGPLSKRYFLVPLQVSIDSQVSEHSRFGSVADFIRYVTASFARAAPADTVLVIKHHPFDRGYHDYTRLIRAVGAEFALDGRLLYIHDQHLPTVLDHIRGAVVINSTVGFTALTHGAPLKPLGVAMYDLPGLTFGGELDEFWGAAAKFRPDGALLQRFRTYMIEQTQINGSFYTGPIASPPSPAMILVASPGAAVRPVNPPATAKAAALPVPAPWVAIEPGKIA